MTHSTTSPARALSAARPFVGLVTALSLLGSACAHQPAGPGPFESSAIVSALASKPPDTGARVSVRDTQGRPYSLSLDELIRAPIPPKGILRDTTLRALASDCTFGPNAIAGMTCWLDHPFLVHIPSPSATYEPPPSAQSSGSVGGSALLVGLLLGAAGATYCGLRCDRPANTIVPVAVGAAAVVALVVGIGMSLRR